MTPSEAKSLYSMLTGKFNRGIKLMGNLKKVYGIYLGCWEILRKSSSWAIHFRSSRSWGMPYRGNWGFKGRGSWARLLMCQRIRVRGQERTRGRQRGNRSLAKLPPHRSLTQSQSLLHQISSVTSNLWSLIGMRTGSITSTSPVA